jgi:AraC-like DNA-binding protein
MNYRMSAAERLANKTAQVRLEVELQQDYSLSPIEAQVLAQRLEQLIDQQTGVARQPGQIVYQAIDLNEPPGKPLRLCRKVPVHLTLYAEGDAQIWAAEGTEGLRRHRVHRLVYEASMQGGALSQEDLACLLGVSERTIKRIFAFYRQQELRLPSRGELQDMGAGVSHKIPVIRKYVQDLSLTRISQELNKHGIGSMARYLRHFALVMVLQDRGVSVAQMQSVLRISENLIRQYQALYAELDVPEYQRTLDRLRQTVFRLDALKEETEPPEPSEPASEAGKKGGRQ